MAMMSLGELLQPRAQASQPTPEATMLQPGGLPAIPGGPGTAPLPQPNLVPPDLMKERDLQRVRLIAQLIGGY